MRYDSKEDNELRVMKLQSEEKLQNAAMSIWKIKTFQI